MDPVKVQGVLDDVETRLNMAIREQLRDRTTRWRAA
jgi:hypothetical protein